MRGRTPIFPVGEKLLRVLNILNCSYTLVQSDLSYPLLTPGRVWEVSPLYWAAKVGLEELCCHLLDKGGFLLPCLDPCLQVPAAPWVTTALSRAPPAAGSGRSSGRERTGGGGTSPTPASTHTASTPSLMVVTDTCSFSLNYRYIQWKCENMRVLSRPSYVKP